MDFDLVIFDCDGVLVDSEPLANRELQRALADCGLALSLDQVVGHFVGLSMTSVLSKAARMLGNPLPADFLEKLQQRTFAVFREELKPVNGVRDVLSALAARKQRICVASSGDFEKINLTLGLTGLKDFFGPNIFSSSQVSRGKPYPDLYLFAAEQMDADPARCLVIEDSVPGVQGAVAAGMEVLAYSATGEGRPLAIAGGMVISHLHDVLEYLQ